MNNFSLQQLRKESLEQNKAIKLVLKDLPNSKNEIILEPEINSFKYYNDDNVCIAKGLIIDLKSVAYAHLIPSEKEKEKNSENIYTTSKRNMRSIP